MSTHRPKPLLRLARTAALLAALLVPLAGCGDTEEPILAPEASESRDHGGFEGGAARAGGWDLPLENEHQLARSFPVRPCLSGPHRDFDFWVGGWDVFSTAGDAIGTNVVTSELDGCLVQEHWVSARGFPGRSLNAYDRETGLWHQDWASAFPQAPTGRLRTSGGLVGGDMVLEGARPTVGGFTIFDRWTWSLESDGSVIQSAETTAPAVGFVSTFTGVYVPSTPTPAPVAASSSCAPGAPGGPTRMGDFLVGEWSVEPRRGRPLARAEITSELGDCVFVEEFRSRGGLRAIAFTYYDYWMDAWFRIWVDSEGERLALRGGFDGPSLVLEGVEGSRRGDVHVRVAWTPDGDDLLQVWEVSKDGGSSWKETARLLYRAR